MQARCTEYTYNLKTRIMTRQKESEPRRLYVVTARSYDTQEESGEIMNDNSGVLRIFANGADAKAYMMHHYADTGLESCSLSMYEDKTGTLQMTVSWHDDDISLSTTRNWRRHEILKCETVELTKHLKLEDSTVMDDIATVLYGL